MKRIHIFTLLAAGLFLAAAIATYQPASHTSGDTYSFASGYSVAPVTGGLCPDVTRPAIIPTPKSVGDTSLPVSLTPAFSYTIGKVRLMGAEGTRPFPMELSVTELTESTLPPLDQGMVNVTDYAAGYRMLPDGMVFNDDISIVLPYDSTLLPIGFSPDNIVTYYYDVINGRWMAIERDSVCTAEALVYSKVNHFTDFINAVIKTPEMPETSAFTPTSIKELEAANPLEGLQLIQAPTANNSGTANLSYQLEIPAGRQGMQPNLALTYSSSGGNGWLGVGWDISVPSITVETRWGVPRYESDWESEVYLYGGEQLVTIKPSGEVRKMPHRTNLNGQTGRLSDGERFYTRAGEAHDSIVRHDSTTRTYWWEVVDRNGVTSYYGAYPPGDTTHGPTRIGGPDGIARWALAATVDPNGNLVRYYYSIDYNAGAGGDMGKQLYLDSINYTGYYSRTDSTAVPGAYTVVFHRNDGREDVTTNARYGFKEVMAATLCNVEVLFNNELVRTFFFVTELSHKSNFKTRLEHLIRVDDIATLDRILMMTHNETCIDTTMYNMISPKIPIVHYDFEYFDYPSPDNMFSESVQQNLHNDGVTSQFTTTSFDGTALGATKGKSWGMGGTATIGYGPDVATTYASGGGNFGYNRSKSNGLLTLIDLDGDGLADKVYKQGTRVYYRPQVRISETQFRFGDSVLLDGISDFLLETDNSVDFGLQLSVVVLAASGGVPASKATTTNYFTDINGDGRPDLVTKKGVYFNCLDTTGRIHFSPASDLAAPTEPGEESYSAFIFSDNLCDVFLWDGEIDPGLECGEDTFWDTIIYNLNPACSHIGDWGRIIILAGDTSFTIEDCTYYHYGNENKIYSYCPDNGWDTLDVCSWTPWKGYMNQLLANDTIHIGDCYYYKPMGSEKAVEIHPHNISQCGPGIGRDPDIDAVKVWIAPMDGTVKVTSRIRLLPDSSESRLQARYVDGVTYTVQHSHGIICDTSFFAGLLDPAHYHACLSSLYDNNVISGNIEAEDTTYHTQTTEISVLKGDFLFFDLNSKDNHSFDKVDWRQEITYQNMNYVGDQYGLDKRHYDSDEDFLLTGESYFIAPKSGDVIISGTIYTDNLTRPARIKISKVVADVIVADSVINILPDTTLPYSLEGANRIIWHVDSGTIIQIKAMPVPTGLTPNWSALTFDPVIRFASIFMGVHDTLEYHLPLQYAIDSSQVYNLQPVWLSSHSIWSSLAYPLYHNLFGTLYRGWGQFGYNNNTFRLPDRAIRLNRLILPRTIMSPPSDNDNIFYDSDFDYNRIDTTRLTESTYLDSLFESLSLYNPLSDSTSWVQVAPYPEYGAYMSYGNVAYFSHDIMANTRMVNLNFREPDEEDDDWDIPEYESVIPVSTDGFPVRTIRKQNISVSGTGSYGANIPCNDEDHTSFSLSSSNTGGTNRITADCMDLNGDGYPDFLTDEKVQYTMPWGGLERATHPIEGEICYTEAWSAGGNFGGSTLLPKRRTGQNSKRQPVTHEGNGSVNGNLGGGNDITTFSYMDINGDGLPDKVSNEGAVWLNLGYGFTSQENWGQAYIREGSSVTTGGNVGIGYPVPDENMACSENFDFAQASINGGVGVTHGSNTTIHALADINGDGMPDEIFVPLVGSASVRYNMGSGQFLQEALPVKIGQGASFSESLSMGVTAGFTFLGMWKLNFGVQSTPQSRSFNRDHLQLVDINGDGYADIVSSDSENEMTVRYNLAGKTNLLRKVTNFCGAYTEMDYALSVPCYEQPQRQWNLQTVSTGELSSGFPTSQLTTLDSIEYRNPHYNRYERLPYGYDTVIVRQYNTEDNNSLYRFTVQGFNNLSFFKRGWKNSESICDADGKMWIEKLYHDTIMDWEHPTDTVGEGDCIALAFTSYEAEITRYYEQESTPQIVTEIVRKYDPYRNVIFYESKGDTTHTDEYLSAEISYCHGLGHNLISLPDTIVVKDKQKRLLQKRVAHYDTLGNLAAIEQFCGDSVSRFDFYHNMYGGVDSLRMPRNYRGQRMSYAYEYDTVVHTYPVRTKDVFGYSSTASYDYRFGKPLTTTDLNGNTMKYHYDEWGRLDTLVGPNELSANKPYTIAMRYHPNLNRDDNPTTSHVSYAITSHYDMQHPTNPIQTILICDGTGRMLQTKKDAEVEGVPMLLNSGRVEYDCFGRTVKQYYPFARNLTDTVYINYFDAATLTTTTYDILDRPLKVILPTLDSTMTVYGFGTDTESGKTYFMSTITDPKGTSVSTLTGTRRQQIKTIAPMGAVTTFTYDALGQLLSSSDPCQHATTYTYDMLGRMIQRVHPDAGTDTYTYDGAGNVTTHSTQVLANANKTINYYYSYNRLDSIVYPTNRQNNVRYTYGDSTASYNQRGRIALMEDASGFQTFIYGRMGEVTENNRTFVLPNESYCYSFKMKYAYDSWNRVQTITYPDGEIVYYKYNTGGMLRQVYGRRSFTTGNDSVVPGPGPGGPVFPRQDEYDDPTADNDFDTTGMGDRATYHNYYYYYIDSIRYNEFEMKSGQWYGNGTHAHYTYDILQRLSHLTSYNSANAAMQDITYTYDKASNVTRINNTAGIVNTLGEIYSYTYTYDSLYRLTYSYGSVGRGKPLANYTLNMQYEADGRITQKNQSGRTRLNGTAHTFNDSKSYTYNTSQPHTVRTVGSTSYQWDANGNMVKDGGAVLTWDEENRLKEVNKSAYGVCFLYDAGGERFYKNSGPKQIMLVNGLYYMNLPLYDDPVLYTSPYLVATPDGYTKHYFVESERFASRIGDGTITGLNTHAAAASALSAKQAKVNNSAPDSIMPNSFVYLRSLPFNWSSHHTTYWQHSDHLGSASWVTDTNGAAYQHLQYMPWGEPLLDQRKSGYTYNTRYTFSGKERDEETGYSYFGARYYNSDLSIWLSVDPLADKYPGVSPYTYCANNPVRLVDPDGRDWVVVKNDDRKTITFQATFYTSKEDASILQGGIEIWKSQTDGYTYTCDGVTYDIEFDFEVKIYDSYEEASAAFPNDERSSGSNIFMVSDEVLFGMSKNDVRGVCDGYNIVLSSSASYRTAAHEIGHALGLADDMGRIDWLMTSGGKSTVIPFTYVIRMLHNVGLMTDIPDDKIDIGSKTESRCLQKYNSHGKIEQKPK